MLDRLVTVADLAGRAGLAVMPILLTGHMSGVNWIPAWALGGSDGDDRFRAVSGGRFTRAGLRNWYARADGSPKPSLKVVKAFTGVDKVTGPDAYEWIDIEPDEFFAIPAVHLPRLYHRYRTNGVTTSP